MANPAAPHVPGNVKPAPGADAPDAPQTQSPDVPPETTVPEGLIGSKDKFSANEMNQFPVQPTVEDALGIERFVGPALDNWTPAPVDPDPAEQERLARVQDRRDEAREARRDAFTSRHPAAAAAARGASDAEKGQNNASDAEQEAGAQ